MKQAKVVVVLMVIALLATSVLAADIDLTSPLGGEYLGGDVVTITWDHIGTCGAPTDAVFVEFSDAAGAPGSWVSVDSVSAQDESYDWDTSALTDGAEYQVRLVSSCQSPDEITGTFTLDKTPPVPALDDETIDEGQGVTLDASASADVDDLSPLVSYEWDLNDDGTIDYTTGEGEDTLDLTWDDLVALGIDNNGDFPMSVTVTDAAGWAVEATATLTVLNVAPEVTVIAPNGGEELRGTITIEYEVSDVVDTAFTCDIYYNDFFAASGLVLLDSVACDLGTNTYDAATFPADTDDVIVHVEVSDGDDTATDESDASFLIDNTLPVVDAGVDQTVDEGDEVLFDFLVEDGLLPSGSWFDDQVDSYFIDFDDGETLTTDDISDIGHTYTDNGVYSVVLRATDDVGLMWQDTVVITVNNVAPTFDALVAQSDEVEGGDLELLEIRFSDVGSADTHSVTIDWGDLSTDIVDPATSPVEDIVHTYEEDGTYTVVITITDDDGDSDTHSVDFTFDNVAPTVLITTPEDDDYLAGEVDVEWESFDAGVLDDVDMLVEYSDDGVDWDVIDSFTESAPVDGTYTTTWDTTPLHDGTYTLRVTVTDDEGGSSEDTVISLIIDNTAPVTLAYEASYDAFSPGSFVWFTGVATDTSPIASAEVVILDEFFDEVLRIPMDTDDGAFDEATEDLAVWAEVDLPEGVYSFYISATDVSGNELNPDLTLFFTETFIVDETHPVYTSEDIDAFIDHLQTQIDANDADIVDLQAQIDAHTLDIADLQDQIDVLSADVDANEAAIAVLEAEMDVVEADIADLELDIADLQAQIDDHTADIADIYSLIDTLETDVDALEARMDTVESDVATLQSDLDLVETDLDVLEIDFAELEAYVLLLYTADEVDAFIADLQDQIDSHTADIDAIGVEIDALDTRVTENEAEIAALELAVTELEADVAEHATELADHETRIAALEADVAGALVDIAALEADLAILEGEVDANTAAITTLQTDLAELDLEVDGLSSDLSALDTRVTDAEADIIALDASFTTLSSDLTALDTRITALDAEVTAYFAFSITDLTTTTQTSDAYDVSVETSSGASCTITDALDATVSTTTVAGTTTHTLSVADGTLGLNIYNVECTEDTYGFTVETTVWVELIGFYNIMVPGSGDGFTSKFPNFFLSLNQLEEAGLADYDVATVLTATDGPDAQRLTTDDVDMVWAYNGTDWASYNVTNATGDFTEFNWTDVPAYYELELFDSAAGKAIMH